MANGATIAPLVQTRAANSHSYQLDLCAVNISCGSREYFLRITTRIRSHHQMKNRLTQLDTSYVSFPGLSPHQTLQLLAIRGGHPIMWRSRTSHG